MAVLGRHWELHTLTFLPPELVHKTINILCQGKPDIRPDTNNTIKSSFNLLGNKTVKIEKSAQFSRRFSSDQAWKALHGGKLMMPSTAYSVPTPRAVIVANNKGLHQQQQSKPHV